LLNDDDDGNNDRNDEIPFHQLTCSECNLSVYT